MKGILYGVGVGPGDPELITLKAINLIRENDVIAVPGKEAKEAVAYKIARGSVPEIEDKELVPVYMPMVMDKEEQERNHKAGARMLEKYLDQGKNVVYITLGDSTIYCTFTYLQDIVEADGYETRLVPGIPSFCAAAARVNKPLVLWNELLHVVPAAHTMDTPLDQELRQYGIDSKFRRKLPDCFRLSVFLQYPLLFHLHSIQRYRFCFKFRIIYAIFVL